MNELIKAGVVILASLTNFFLGFVVFRNNPKGKVNITFLFIALFMGLWGLCLLFYQFPFVFSSVFWIKATYLTASVCTSIIFFFSFIFPRPIHRRFWLGAAAFAASYVGFTFWILFRTRLWITDVITDPIKGLQTIWGTGYYWWLLGLWIVAIWSLVNAIASSRVSSGVERLRARYFFITFCVFCALVCIPDVIVPVFFHTTSYFFLSAVFGFVFSGAIAYAIVRHRLMDIRIVVARSVSYSMLAIMLASVYAAGMFLAGTFLYREQTSATSTVISTILALIIAFSFQPLERIARKITNRIFFTAYYDSDALLSELAHIMAETIDLEKIVNRLLETLLRKMNISKGAFLIVKNHAIADTLGIGYADHTFAVPQLEELFHQATGTSPYFLFEDFEEGQLKQLFRKSDITIAIPIKVENAEVALLVLGGKKSGEIYYEKDINLLSTFASEAGIAIRNAQAYTEIKKFSKELEQRVEERTKELREAQARELAEARNVARLKDEFVFIAAHELRTPVATIKGFLELVSPATAKFSKDVREKLNAIGAASNVLSQLINDLLEVARSEANALPISVTPTDVMPIIEKVVGQLVPLAAEHRVHVRTEKRGGGGALVDPQKTHEVFTNLLSNAIEYNRERGTVDIAVFSQGNELVVEFKDTGYGIPKDQQAKVFQKFFRARGKGTEEILGTGLGLFITRMLTEKMGGRVAFSSVEGTGTTFSVSFPAAPSSQNP